MKLLRAGLVTLSALLLAACVPNAVTYYRPAVDGGKVLRPRCVPTESIAEFTLPDPLGRLRVRAWADSGSHLHQIVLFFSGSGWREIHFAATDFRIRDLEENLVRSASSVIAYQAERTVRLTAEPYRAPPERPGLSRLHVQVRSERPLPGRFELLCPAIVIDGEEMKFPVIRFEQQRWIGISPFNC